MDNISHDPTVVLSGQPTQDIPRDNNSMMKKIIPIMGIILIVVLIGSGGYILGINTKNAANTPTPTITNIKGCTQEAKICPDGTSVGRTGPNCEFAPCPSVFPTTSTIPSTLPITNTKSSAINDYLTSKDIPMKEYRNENYGFLIWYPEILNIDEQNLTISGAQLGNKKIYIEFSTNSIRTCKDNCDVIKNLGSVTLNKNLATLIVGAKKRTNGELFGHYITYELFGNGYWTYITLKFDDEQPTVEEMAVFQKIVPSFEYIPKKTNTINPTIMQLPRAGKPVIYLYPEHEQEVYVKLNYRGTLLSTYPYYDYSIKGWKVIAYPDGRIINLADQKEYSYLFWEGESPLNIYEIKKGFVVEGYKTKEFLQNTLKKIGLIPKEYNEFIVYWLPKLEKNRYNLIYFAGEEYTSTALLDIDPKPDSLLRVFMVYKPLDKEIEVPVQEIKTFNRKGFLVVEWGGREIEY